MIFEISGKVDGVGKVQTFSSGFTKRDILVDLTEPKSKFPNIVKFTAVKDKCCELDGLKKGDMVKVKFAIDGRKWEGPKGTQYFTDLKIITIDNANGVSNVPSPAEPDNADVSMDACDDMPF